MVFDAADQRLIGEHVELLHALAHAIDRTRRKLVVAFIRDAHRARVMGG